MVQNGLTLSIRHLIFEYLKQKGMVRGNTKRIKSMSNDKTKVDKNRKEDAETLT